MGRLLSPVLAGAILLAACTGAGESESADNVQPTVTTAAAPSTTGPPVVLAVAEELALLAGQCWGPLPTPQPETSLPASLTVAVVDCAGAHSGFAYGNGCLAAEAPDARDPVIVVPCPGHPDDPWPGLRALQRAAVSACLPLFDEQVGERYATSDQAAVELLPTEELWALGERRYVCTAQPGEPE